MIKWYWAAGPLLIMLIVQRFSSILISRSSRSSLVVDAEHVRRIFLSGARSARLQTRRIELTPTELNPGHGVPTGEPRLFRPFLFTIGVLGYTITFTFIIWCFIYIIPNIWLYTSLQELPLDWLPFGNMKKWDLELSSSRTEPMHGFNETIWNM